MKRAVVTGLVIAAALLAVGSLISVSALFAQQATTQAFRFDNITEGQTLSGEISVIARGLTGLSAVQLWLDGKHYSSGTVRQDNSGFSVHFGLPTQAHANGRHTLELRLGPSLFDRRNVRFQNMRHSFRSTDISRAGASSHITGTVYPDAPWKAIIENNRGDIVHVWHGKGLVVNLSWNGRDEHGRDVPNGTYRFKAVTEPLGETFACPVIKHVPGR